MASDWYAECNGAEPLCQSQEFPTLLGMAQLDCDFYCLVAHYLSVY